MRALQYAFNEAIASLWRGRQSGILATGTITIALFVLGGVLLVTTNLERLGAEWGRSAELSVYLDDEATDEEKIAIERLIAPGSLVAGYDFVSKDEAMVRFASAFADLASAVDVMEGNPLPASYEVRLQAAPGSADAVASLAAELTNAPGVADVRYDRQWLDRLLAAVMVIEGIGLALGTLLTVAAALTIANVVRLSLLARHGEIEVMQLVGAPQGYVRGPFVMEGLLQGGIGAAVALAALAAAFLALRRAYLVPLADALNLTGIRFLSLELCVLLLVGGMMVGCLGGFVATSGRT